MEDGLKQQVLALPNAQKQDIYLALQDDLNNQPIPEPLLQVLEERRREYKSGNTTADSAKSVFVRLLAKYPTDRR